MVSYFILLFNMMLPLKIIQKIYIKIRHQKDYTDGIEYETKNPEVSSCLCIHFCKSASSTQRNRQSFNERC